MGRCRPRALPARRSNETPQELATAAATSKRCAGHPAGAPLPPDRAWRVACSGLASPQSMTGRPGTTESGKFVPSDWQERRCAGRPARRGVFAEAEDDDAPRSPGRAVPRPCQHHQCGDPGPQCAGAARRSPWTFTIEDANNQSPCTRRSVASRHNTAAGRAPPALRAVGGCRAASGGAGGHGGGVATARGT